MGFGWLFIGYFFVSVVSLYSPLSFAMLAGYPLMILGLFRLAPYHNRFRSLFYLSFIALPFAVYFSLYGIYSIGLSGIAPIFAGRIFEIVNLIYSLFFYAFQLLMLFAVAGIAAELGLLSVGSEAWRNFFLVAFTLLLDTVARLPFLASLSKYFALPLLLLRVCCIFLNLWLLYRAYRWICPAGEEENSKKDKTQTKGEGKHD